MRLFWRVVVVNGLVFAVGSALLVFSPISVSAQPAQREAVVLLGGAVVLLLVNGMLIRWALAPLAHLQSAMADVDLLKPSRVALPGSRDFRPLVAQFNAMLSRLERERGQSSGRVLLAQEGERRRIAQELHDEIGQTLTVVLLALKRCLDEAPEELRPDLLLAQEAARSGLDDVRRVANRLRPGVLEDLGLTQAIAAQAAEVANATGLRVRRELAQVRGLAPDVELVLYRVAQEALTNVARHACASTVDVVLAQDETGVTLTVTDDGVGLRGSTDGNGIVGMRERALLVGGRLDVGPAGPAGSAGGPGSRIRCVIPATDPVTDPASAEGSEPA